MVPFHAEVAPTSASMAHTQMTMVEKMSDTLLGVDRPAWVAAVVVGVALLVAGIVFKWIRAKTYRKAGRLPVLILYGARLFMQREDWERSYTEDWCPDVEKIMEGPTPTWASRFRRYAEAVTFALSLAVKGSRLADQIFTERPPVTVRAMKAIAALIRFDGFKVAVILLLTAGVGAGVTAMIDMPMSVLTRIAMGAGISLSLGCICLLSLRLRWRQRR
ncbi:hypothetical protein ACFZBM_39350 [Streptomyces lavendulae]|uniref:Uncharacterized protein n=1 Tax=Streptomyces lavendulae subsp. lavendulae TaxID=58340 RepID=A0A2K8PSQ7_STRLA|nr:hypothetical protein [Streptomyces lavendulae]ATZ22073.1 hypothetical protein SLAV_00715 [Streptomyces lavendulae subsp. lavendulae]ATZ29498.1 hypothetical protein SLAV_38675 [Streptomyces lavendulae subsp. lavendulae]